MNEALLIYPNIISKNQNNVWLAEVRSLITPTFYFCFLFTFFSPNSQPSSQCLQAHPLSWVGLPYLTSFKNKIGVGRNGLFVSPSLRTGLADLPHPALQLMVLPKRGLTSHFMGG